MNIVIRLMVFWDRRGGPDSIKEVKVVHNGQQSFSSLDDSVLEYLQSLIPKPIGFEQRSEPGRLTVFIECRDYETGEMIEVSNRKAVQEFAAKLERKLQIRVSLERCPQKEVI